MVVEVEETKTFARFMSKTKDSDLKSKVKTQVKKIINNPEIGKPMRHSRKGTRELYVKPYRLSYLYLEKENKVVILNVYHKDNQ